MDIGVEVITKLLTWHVEIIVEGIVSLVEYCMNPVKRTVLTFVGDKGVQASVCAETLRSGAWIALVCEA